jgi:predicted DNA-binding transcriptional regulator YafY
LNFNYYSPASDEKSARMVDPYHLFNYMGTWHLIGYCHLRKDIRDFALNRISEVVILDEAFDIPSNFDFKDCFLSSFGLYKGKPSKQVTLKFSPAKSKWIKDQIWHKDQKVKYLKDGSIQLSFPVANFSEIKMEILKHGSDVEVIMPKSLRNLIKAEAEKIVRIY